MCVALGGLAGCLWLLVLVCDFGLCCADLVVWILVDWCGVGLVFLCVFWLLLAMLVDFVVLLFGLVGSFGLCFAVSVWLSWRELCG